MPPGGEDPLRCGVDKGRLRKKRQMTEATFVDRLGQMRGARWVQPWIRSNEPPEDMSL